MDLGDEATKFIRPGPSQPTHLLRLQHVHRSEAVWKDNEFRKNVLRSRCGYTSNQIPEHIIPYLKSSGFYGAAMVPQIPIQDGLITALVERWRPETHTFHFPTGEMTITLQDVSILLGLPIDGPAISGKIGDQPYIESCQNLLGRVPPPELWSFKRVKVRWFNEEFRVLSDHATVEETKCFARAYIMRLIGRTLCPDRSGNYVHMMWLPHLANLSESQQPSWGSTVLTFLYRELCKATDPKIDQFCGAGILLQLWAWERLPFITPLDARVEFPRQLFPPSYRWSTDSRKPLQIPKEDVAALFWYRDAFDNLRERQVQWQPYLRILTSGDVPAYCIAGRQLWRTIVPLISFHIVEWHQPDRVLRQFGLQQHIPSEPMQNDMLHTIDLRGGNVDKDWTIEHRVYLDTWAARRRYDIQMPPSTDVPHPHSQYMSWYSENTRRWISPVGALVGNLVDGLDAIHIRTREACNPEDWELIHKISGDLLRAADQTLRLLGPTDSDPAVPVGPPRFPDTVLMARASRVGSSRRQGFGERRFPVDKRHKGGRQRNHMQASLQARETSTSCHPVASDHAGGSSDPHPPDQTQQAERSLSPCPPIHSQQSPTSSIPTPPHGQLRDHIESTDNDNNIDQLGDDAGVFDDGRERWIRRRRRCGAGMHLL